MAEAPLVFRAMTEEDLSSVLAMEKDLFPDPWPRWMFLEDIRGVGRALAVVGEEAGAVVCYGIVWRVGEEFHIADMAVRRDRQGAGIGKKLLDHLLAEGKRGSSAVATLEVRPSNARALRLYRSRAFREVAVRPGYYRNGEDALVMLRELSGGTEKNGGLVQEER